MPNVRSIRLSEKVFFGDREYAKYIEEYTYEYKNELTMRSLFSWLCLSLDLPSLTEFVGGGGNYSLFGFVVLESMGWCWSTCRYPSTVSGWNSISRLL